MRQYTEAYKMHCAAVAIWNDSESSDPGDLLGYINNLRGYDTDSCGYDSKGRYVELNKLDKSGELTNNELRLKIAELEKSKIYAFAVDNKYLCIHCTNIERFLESESRDESDIFIADFNVIKAHIDNSWFSKVKFKFALISGYDDFSGETRLPFNDTIHTQKGLDLIDYADVLVECIDNEYVNISNCYNISLKCSVVDGGWFTVKNSEYCSIFIDGLGKEVQNCIIQDVNNSYVFVDNIESILRFDLCYDVSIVTRKKYEDKILFGSCKNCNITFIDDAESNNKIMKKLLSFGNDYIRLGNNPFETKTILAYAMANLNSFGSNLIKDSIELNNSEQMDHLDKLLYELDNCKTAENVLKRLTKFKMLVSGDVRVIGGKYIVLEANDRSSYVGLNKADITYCIEDYIPTDAVMSNSIIYKVHALREINVNGSLNANRIQRHNTTLNIANASIVSILKTACSCVNVSTKEKCEILLKGCSIGCINILNSNNIDFARFTEHCGNINIANSIFDALEIQNTRKSIINISNCHGKLEIIDCDGYMLIINGKIIDINSLTKKMWGNKRVLELSL